MFVFVVTASAFVAIATDFPADAAVNAAMPPATPPPITTTSKRYEGIERRSTSRRWRSDEIIEHSL